MSKTIEIKFSVDVENQAEVKNLINILEGFLGQTDEKSATTEKQTPKKKEPAKRKPAAAKKETPKKEEPAQEAEEAKDDIKIEDVRSLLAKKVGDHRTEIKAKLTELGANNVTSLDKSKYPEFTEFLNGL